MCFYLDTNYYASCIHYLFIIVYIFTINVNSMFYILMEMLKQAPLNIILNPEIRR